ncbi:MAG: helix-turn-helix transcriptional regulator [Oscillospiraceae bacterium]|nr:helix-turn-helix transcriptional regulator [Oscillospiraceae bacterium]
MSSLGQWLKNERKKHGLNLSDLARKAGISKSTVCRIENEQVLASFGSAVKMAEAMGLTLGDFFVRRNKEKEVKQMPERKLKIVEHLPVNGNSVNKYDVFIDGEVFRNITAIKITADARERPFKEVQVTFVVSDVEWVVTES